MFMLLVCIVRASTVHCLHRRGFAATLFIRCVVFLLFCLLSISFLVFSFFPPPIAHACLTASGQLYIRGWAEVVS